MFPLFLPTGFFPRGFCVRLRFGLDFGCILIHPTLTLPQLGKDRRLFKEVFETVGRLGRSFLLQFVVSILEGLVLDGTFLPTCFRGTTFDGFRATATFPFVVVHFLLELLSTHFLGPFPFGPFLIEPLPCTARTGRFPVLDQQRLPTLFLDRQAFRIGRGGFAFEAIPIRSLGFRIRPLLILIQCFPACGKLCQFIF